MNIYGFTAVFIALFFLVGAASGQETIETTDLNKNVNASALSAVDIPGLITVSIFFGTILLIVIIAARNYSNTSKMLLGKALEENKELPEELQEPVSVIIKAFPQAEPLGLPRGSLRAIVVLIFSFAFVFLLLFPPKQINEMITALEIILAILIGFYFGSRYAESRIIKPESTGAGIGEIQGIKEAGIKEIIPTEVIPEEKPEERKRRRKREELI